jgi:hypothetical protein
LTSHWKGLMNQNANLRCCICIFFVLLVVFFSTIAHLIGTIKHKQAMTNKIAYVVVFEIWKACCQNGHM